jgi:2-polyprenyl-3-methyl-5-hydroxy-6-metoxy-1,4-benzoquinol methylase
MLGSELKYDKTLSCFERVYISIFGVPINGLRIRARRILPEIKGNYRNILDIGSGQGIITYEIARRFPQSEVVGIDILENLVERDNRVAKIIGLENCRFEVMDIMNIDYENYFDLVVTVDILEHIKDDERALKQFNKVLKPGGLLLLHVPAYERRWLFFGWKVNFDVDGHFRPGYSIEDISKKINDAGFEIVEAYHSYGWIETVTNNISYLITEARMKRKILYAFVFPFLNFFSWFGKNSRPKKGAGVMVKAKKA